MITVDVGNTSVGVGLWRGEQVELRRFASPDEAAVLLEGAVFVASVSPPRLAALRRALPAGRASLSCLVDPPLDVVDPRLLVTAGADRLAAALAVVPGPAVVVDAGTAVTLELVDGQGLYLGGFIAPGLTAALEGLHRAAPALPRVPGRPVPLAPGVETVGAMEAGAWGLQVGGIDRLVQVALETLGAPARLVATGGAGRAWARDSRHAGIEVDEALVHRGLRRWARSGR